MGLILPWQADAGGAESRNPPARWYFNVNYAKNTSRGMSNSDFI